MRKGERTKQALLDTAEKLFAERGYEATTMRAIATEAGVSTGLAYRYFDGKPAIVSALYAQMAQAFLRAADLPRGTWVVRGLAALDASLAVLAPHREALASLMASSSDANVYPPLAATAPHVEGVFREAVLGSSNPPSDASTIAELLYFGQLAILLFWVLDRSRDQRATAELRGWVGSLSGPVALGLRIPGVMGPVRRLLDIVRLGVLGDARREEA